MTALAGRHLREQTGSVSPPGCNGCGEGCSPVDSDRFPGGLSFRDCQGYGYDAPTYARFALPLPFAAAPADTYRVTATGGPPTVGGTGAGVATTTLNDPLLLAGVDHPTTDDTELA